MKRCNRRFLLFILKRSVLLNLIKSGFFYINSYRIPCLLRLSKSMKLKVQCSQINPTAILHNAWFVLIPHRIQLLWIADMEESAINVQLIFGKKKTNAICADRLIILFIKMFKIKAYHLDCTNRCKGRWRI